ncbi:rho guanine nucleotide exchange factor 38 [Engraulis encrasicolus]|uniref:rho guanine nucleotide exchange factor 38 n=1 Tax=Engraulis encrasicolus TaxID=184585 RepID=UPI002FD54E91
MDPNEAGGNEKEKEEKKEKDKTVKRRKRLLLRYLERRKTDTIVDDDSSKGDINIGTLVRRSQSDKTEYSARLKEKMAPHDLSSPASPALDPEELRQRKMAKRAKVIEELVKTENDYFTDLDLCIREVLQPLRVAQVVDVDRLFTNMESVCAVSAELLHRLQEATAEPDPLAVLTGEVFIQAKAVLEEVYKIYCYHHDDANTLLKSYEKEKEIQQHFRTCIGSLKQIYAQEGKSNLLDMGSLLIKPVQRIMKYPLLLAELWQATPEDHPDHQPLQEALASAKIINLNINEFKRRKDIVMKYKRSDGEGTLKGRLNKFNIHSIRKKSDRLTGHFKILTGVEPQVRDELFDKEEKMFRSLEKAVRLLVKNVLYYLQQAQEMVSVTAENARDLEKILMDPDIIDTNGFHRTKNDNTSTDPYKHFIQRMERLVLAPLSSLQSMFAAPQKLIQKRYDKLLDYCSRLESRSSPSSSSSSSPSSLSPSPSEESCQAGRDYQALNAQLVEELQRFNLATQSILSNCLLFLVALLQQLTELTRQRCSSIHQLPAPLSNISEVQNSIMEELANLTFVKDNAQRLMERKVSFEKREKKIVAPEIQRQEEGQRARLLQDYPAEKLYQLKRNCNACQEMDVSLLEGEVVALLEDHDPLGSSSRWLVDTGGTQGYVYSSFLKVYNPQREQARAQAEQAEDFDNLSLFVSGSSNTSLRSFNLHVSDSSSTLSGLQVEPEGPEDTDTSDDQQFYAVYAFQARSDQELTLQESQHVRILKFSDLGGNKDWWLAEVNGQKGYVPANYLGKMSYA